MGKPRQFQDKALVPNTLQAKQFSHVKRDLRPLPEEGKPEPVECPETTNSQSGLRLKGGASKVTQVYISYVSEDCSKEAGLIKKQLEKRGLKVSDCNESYSEANKFARSQALMQSDIVVVLASKNYAVGNGFSEVIKRMGKEVVLINMGETQSLKELQKQLTSAQKN